MKNNFRRILHSFSAQASFSPFPFPQEPVDPISDVIASLDNSENYDIIEYDYITKTERVIPWESIPDYSRTTTTTYELASMQQVLSGRQTENTVSPFAIINPDDEFFLTPPKTSRGVPTTPYSGVVFILAEIDSDHDGIVDKYERGTGFLVSPNVVVTCSALCGCHQQA